MRPERGRSGRQRLLVEDFYEVWRRRAISSVAEQRGGGQPRRQQSFAAGMCVQTRSQLELSHRRVLDKLRFLSTRSRIDLSSSGDLEVFGPQQQSHLTPAGLLRSASQNNKTMSLTCFWPDN